jgi:hypothetical protein
MFENSSNASVHGDGIFVPLLVQPNCPVAVYEMVVDFLDGARLWITVF